MGWRDRFKCQVTMRALGVEHHWSAQLPLPDQIPLKLLLLNHSDFHQHSKCTKRGLSLEHRKELWVYQHTHPSVWSELSEQFAHWVHQHAPLGAIDLDVVEAATPVVLKFLSQTKIQSRITVRVHHAPLAWLEREFAKPRKKNVSLQQVTHPDCLWATTLWNFRKLAA